MDFRNSRMPSRLSAWLAHRGRSMWTLLGLRIMCLLPMAAAISFLNGSRALNAKLARSLPVVSATRLRRPELAGAAEAGAARARGGAGSCQAASAAAPPGSELRRNSLREFGTIGVIGFKGWP